MADARILSLVEETIRTKWLPKKFHQSFDQDELSLSCGGTFSCDAVSKDKKIAVLISTCSYGTVPMRKIYSDIYYLLLSPGVERRVIVFTEPDLFNYFEERQQKCKRVHHSIEFILCDLSSEQRKRLSEFKVIARMEAAGR